MVQSQGYTSAGGPATVGIPLPVGSRPLRQRNPEKDRLSIDWDAIDQKLRDENPDLYYEEEVKKLKTTRAERQKRRRREQPHPDGWVTPSAEKQLRMDRAVEAYRGGVTSVTRLSKEFNITQPMVRRALVAAGFTPKTKPRLGDIPDHKTCENPECGKTYHRRDGEAKAFWNNRRTCGRDCAYRLASITRYGVDHTPVNPNRKRNQNS